MKYLLEAGRTVHATVRDPSKRSSVGHLRDIAANAPGKLVLFRAELLEPGSYDAAAQGCERVTTSAGR